MRAAGIKSTAVLDELESHLREQIDAMTAAGDSPEEAFASSISRLGQSDALREEFKKLADSGRGRIKNVILTFAGVPHTHLTEMNALNPAPGFEPRWATYLKSLIFVAPAICLWSFSVIFIFP